MNKKIFYTIPAYGDNYKYETTTGFEYSTPEWIAEDCAEDFFTNHDGWECTWPNTFYLYKKEDDENFFAKVEVEMESEPVFMGTKK